MSGVSDRGQLIQPARYVTATRSKAQHRTSKARPNDTRSQQVRTGRRQDENGHGSLGQGTCRPEKGSSSDALSGCGKAEVHCRDDEGT